MPTEYPRKVALIDYDEILFAPMGFEQALLAQGEATWVTAQCHTLDETLTVARDADVVVVQTVRPLLPRKSIETLSRCRCIIRAGAGYDSVDYVAATELGVMVCNTPTYCSDDVADLALALLLGCVRHVPRLDAFMKKGQYARALAVPTRRLRGSTLGIIGLGRIGSTVARNVRGWGMTILACDPYVGQERGDEFGVAMVPFGELLERSDFVSVHCPLTPETRHMLDRAAFARAKQGLIVVNSARGPIIDEEALIEALRSGKLAGAGLDVTEHEPLPPHSPLLTMDNVVLTPHVGANSAQAREDLYRLICEVSLDVVQGRIPRFVVNPQVLSRLRPVPAA